MEGVVNRLVVEAVTAKFVAVAAGHRRWRSRQLHASVEKRPVPGAEIGMSVVVLQRSDQFFAIVLDLGTEVYRVRLGSVMTIIGPRNGHCDHFPLRPRQLRRTMHHSQIQLHGRLQRPRFDAHQTKHLGHVTRPMHGGVVHAA